MSILRKTNAYRIKALGVRPLCIVMGLALVATPVTFAHTVTATGGGGFVNQPFAGQSSQFTSEFDATPSLAPIDAGVGYSHVVANSFGQTSTFVRFSPTGKIDARNGAGFAAAASIPYYAGLTYHFRLDVDVIAQTYSVFVKLPGKASNPLIKVGTDFAFRTTANGVFNLDSLVVHVNQAQGKLTVSNFVVTALAPQVPNPDCTIIVPAHPLTAAGLATPYQLVATDPGNGPCHELNPDQSAFVQAAIIDPATGQISIYNPLVIDKGSTPAAAPVIPKLPANAVVALWFGYNANDLKQQAASGSYLDDSHCVNGHGNSLFGQFSYCNAVAFFETANYAIKEHKLVVPPLGTGADARPCPSVRDFSVVDQDQSDNVTSTFLETATGLIAQNTAANLVKFPGAKVHGNPSDNRLVDVLWDTAVTCTPWKAPDLADPGKLVPALPLNELQSAAFTLAPVALIPDGDPMVLNDGNNDLTKVNLYRAGVNQPHSSSLDSSSTTAYCANFRAIAPPKIFLDQILLKARPSPFPDMADSLFTFIAQRYVASYQILNCEALLHKAVNMTLTTNADGVVTGATLVP